MTDIREMAKVVWKKAIELDILPMDMENYEEVVKIYNLLCNDIVGEALTYAEYYYFEMYFVRKIQGQNLSAGWLKQHYATMNRGDYYYFIEKKLTKSLYYHSLAGSQVGVLRIWQIIYNEKTTLDKYFFQSFPYLKKLEDLPPIVSLCISLYEKEVNVLENAYKYAPGEDGYKEALGDYQERLTTRTKLNI